MAWGKIGADTATSATPTLKVDIATPNNFVSFMNHIFVSGSNNNHEVSFNSDQAYVYAHRSCANGGSEGLSTNTREIGGLSNNSSDKMQVGYVADFAGEEKLCIMFQIDAMGADNVPTRCESYFKYVPASASRITDIVSHDDGWFGSPTADRYATNSNLTLLGSDLTPSAGKPTDVQAGSRWEETDTRKMYHYNAPTLTFEDDFSSDTWTGAGNSGTPTTITISGGDLSAVNIAVAGDDRMYKAIGTTLSDTAWVLQFETNVSSSGSGEPVPVGFVDGTGNLNGESILVHYNGGALIMREYNGSSLTEVGSGISISTGTQYYVTVIRTSLTGITLEVRTGSHTGTLVGSESGTITGSVDLDTIQSGVYGRGSGTASYDIDNVKVYNGITSLDNVWSEEGT